MYPTVNIPGVTRPALGQFAPMVVPSIPGIEPAAPAPPAPAAESGDGAAIAAVALLGLVGLASGVVSTLFYYGVAQESKSGTVKTPGYILAGVSALSTLVTLGATGLAVFAAGSRR